MTAAVDDSSPFNFRLQPWLPFLFIRQTYLYSDDTIFFLLKLRKKVRCKSQLFSQVGRYSTSLFPLKHFLIFVVKNWAHSILSKSILIYKKKHMICYIHSAFSSFNLPFHNKRSHLTVQCLWEFTRENLHNCRFCPINIPDYFVKDRSCGIAKYTTNFVN